ncbi:MAG TPA: UDP-glucose/GDP-mannose dehydrogenase family protein [Candidatus Goldiibacteriota bacterium]|nr:UDP-glucose/GDP-mannose dehydrogenase family protein [Candidatus Goldiibacteriota bacterium]
MKICVIGVGYVGLVTGACLSDLGNSVICVDIDKTKIDNLKKGILPIYEPGLSELVKRNKSRLKFTTNVKEGVQKSDVIFIAVGTPPKENGEADLTYVKEVAKSTGKFINGYKIIVDKSTVPVGMGDLVESIISDAGKDNKKFDVVSCPEFLREGNAIHDFMNPDRLIIGAKNKTAANKVAEIFQPLNTKIMITDLRSAEMIKYASNSFLATKISFINEIANICEKVGADVETVATGMGLDKRIGRSFLNAGAGFGGSCFPKDVSALINIARSEDYEPIILKAVMEVNRLQRKSILTKIKKILGTIEGRTIGILGISFKPETDDIRDAVSIEVMTMLLEKGCRIKAYDPAAIENSKKVVKGVKYVRNAYDVAENSECLVILTEWNEFKELDLRKIKKLMKLPNIVDGRNIYDPAVVKKFGFNYIGIGRN